MTLVSKLFIFYPLIVQDTSISLCQEKKYTRIVDGTSLLWLTN